MSWSGELLSWSGRNAKRIVIAVIGAILILAGVAMLALPGPGMLTIAAGLAVLATEYGWAGRLLSRIRDKVRGARGRLGERTHGRQPTSE